MQPATPSQTTSRPGVIVDLGCGWRKKAGAIGVDVIADVMRPLPLRDNSVDEL